MANRTIRLGVVGLGRAFSLMLPTFTRDRRVMLVAAADTRAEARQQFRTDFSAPAYATMAELCADPNVEAVYIATPHQRHAEHAILAAASGKHVLVEKPLALSIEECEAVIAAVQQAGVHLVVGHSHSFDAPIQRARMLIDSGTFGRVRMIAALNFTDFLYRPRRPEELATASGGGVIFSQGAHQIDIVRFLAGSPARSIRAAVGSWDAARPTEGAYSALLSFSDGAFASLVYSGYAHFDSDELCGWVGELGQQKNPADYGAARSLLAQATNAGDEAALKNLGSCGGADQGLRGASPQAAARHQHFGLVVVSCDKADLRPLPTGVAIFEDGSARLDALPAPSVPRVEVIDELHQAVVHGRKPAHGGEWALGTLEVCLAMIRSAHERREILLERQTGPAEIDPRRQRRP